MRLLGPALLLLFLGATACRAIGGAGTSLPKGTTLEIRGNEVLPTKELRAVVAEEIERSGLEVPDKAAIDDAAYALETHYLRAGFPFVTVDYAFEQRDTGVLARFDIVEGVRTKLTDVLVTGITAFDEEELEAFLATGDDEYFVESELRSRRGALRELYLQDGYLRVEIQGPEVEWNDSREAASATFRVVEGPQFVIREVVFQGGLPELEVEQAALASGFVGRPYVPRRSFELRAAVLDFYGRRAHPDCEVAITPELDEITGDVRLGCRVQPGSAVTISGIRVEGNTDVGAGRVRDITRLEVGEPYDAEKVRDAFRELYRTKLFDSVRIELEEGDGEQRDLIVQVVETPSLEFYFEPGWGSYEGPRVRIGVDELNVFGTGFRANLETNLSELAQGLSLSVSDPAFFGSAVEARTSVFYNWREEPSFTYSEIGTGVGFLRRWNRNVSTNAGYTFRSTKIEDEDLGAVIPDDILEDVDIGSIAASLLIDDRDNLLLPTRGARAQFQLEWASDLTLSQLDFLKPTASLTGVHSFREGTVLAGHYLTSVIIPTEDTDAIPIQERLFNGGENSVRSFEESELGPKDASGEPVGGEVKNVFSVELRQRVVGNLSGVVFTDLGNVELFHENYFRFNDMRAAIGIGVRYLLPIGPLRLDWGVNPNPRDDEEDWVLHFSVGWPY